MENTVFFRLKQKNYVFMKTIVIFILFVFFSAPLIAASLPPCTEKDIIVSETLDIFIPLATYESLNGSSNIWVQFKFKGHDPDNGIFWVLSNYGEVDDPLDCGIVPKASVALSLDLHISSAILQSEIGDTNIWADLEYYGEAKDSQGKGIGEILWRLKKFGNHRD